LLLQVVNIARERGLLARRTAATSDAPSSPGSAAKAEAIERLRLQFKAATGGNDFMNFEQFAAMHGAPVETLGPVWNRFGPDSVTGSVDMI